MKREKQKAFFASLKNTKLLCFYCKEIKKVSSHLGKSIVKLECGHTRSLKEIDLEKLKVQEVLDSLDGNKNFAYYETDYGAPVAIPKHLAVPRKWQRMSEEEYYEILAEMEKFK